jgi:aminomethyltransferase
MSDNKNLIRTPLYENHKKLNARLVPFAGWEMPVQYTNIIKEHMHTRTSVSVFDISHMGEFVIKGDNAEIDLENLISCRISTLSSGCCRYGFLLNDNGCFIDDTIIYKYNSKHFMIVVNASQIDSDSFWIREHLSEDTSFTDISSETAKIDLQGPLSFESASRAFPDIDFMQMGKFTFLDFEHDGVSLTASTTGYTGELGFEFFMPNSHASTVWENFLSFKNVEPAGFGARDSLRLEKGFSLYGHDISDKITPLEANLERFVNFDKEFIGKKILQNPNLLKTSRSLTPFLCEGRITARDGFEIFRNNKSVGHVASGVYSPVLKKGIGLAFIDRRSSAVGSIIECRENDIKIKAIIVDLPFVR